MERLAIGLSAWIIQDGNYPDFAVGDAAAFALEFYSEEGLSPITENTADLVWQRDAHYLATGRVAHVASDWWVVDFGLLMFREERPPPDALPGQWLRGEIFVGIDPFFYFERLAKEISAPALIYDWAVEDIEVETAPLIEVAPRLLARDESRRGMRKILKTDAWADDSGSAEYVLTCRRLAEHQARRTLGRE